MTLLHELGRAAEEELGSRNRLTLSIHQMYQRNLLRRGEKGVVVHKAENKGSIKLFERISSRRKEVKKGRSPEECLE